VGRPRLSAARPRAGVHGNATILRFLERQDYPAERLAVDDPVSDFDSSAVLVTRLVEGVGLPDGTEKFATMGELLERLHALPYDDSTIPPAARERIDAAVNAYRRHIEPTDDELQRLEAVMYIRTLYLACFDYRRAVNDGVKLRERG
jgi:hypothetical protein